MVQIDGTIMVKPHQPIHLAIYAPACHVFDTAGEALQVLIRQRPARGLRPKPICG